MKRWFLRIVLFLILGAIANIAVACWIAIERRPAANSNAVVDENSFDWVNGEPIVTTIHKSPGRMELRQEIKDWPGLLLPSFDYPSSLTPKWSRVRLGHSAIPVGAANDRAAAREYVECATGWPYLAFRCWRLLSGDWANHRVVDSAGALKVGPRAGFGEGVLPYIPIWPGFAINTVFYAVDGWLLFAGPFVVRRWRRIRRGLCPKCAYDLRGSPAQICPECGAAFGRTPTGMTHG